MTDFQSLLLAIPVFAVFYGLISMAGSSKRRRPAAGRMPASAPGASFIQQSLHTVGQSRLSLWLLERGGMKASLESRLAAAGYPFGWRAEEALVLKGSAALALLLVWLAASIQDPWLAFLMTVGGFFLPDLYLAGVGSSRKHAMQKQLPGFVDLLALTLESGLDLLVASERIMDKMKPGPFKQELASLIQEYRLGTERKAALTRWSARTGLSDAVSLTSLIIQSDEIGGDLPTVLRSYAEDLRTRRILNAEEIAGKIPVKILFPMVVFFFPIIFVIILGPIGMEFLKTWQ